MKNPMKIMAISTLALVVIILAVVLLKKSTVVLEDETGGRLVGYTSKLDLSKAEPTEAEVTE